MRSFPRIDIIVHKDWDTYRNHSIGFIFQSYHLIPHQTILQNVELALLISGVSKEERRKRAIAALERVGLGDKLKMRVEYCSASSGLCVTIMTRRSAEISFKSSIICTLVLLSSAPVGSSASTISGSFMRARAMATRCRCCNFRRYRRKAQDQQGQKEESFYVGGRAMATR